MSYKRYVARVERRRALLKCQLQEANHLRAEAHLPLRDIHKVVADQVPLLTKDEYAKRLKERYGFSQFRTQQLTQANFPLPDQGTDWQEERARFVRLAFFENGIQMAWHKRMGTSPS